MLEVSFFDKNEKFKWQYAVIVSRYHGKWLFCKHKERGTYECPGGHWEEGETIFETAKRELFEETGALEYELEPVAAYSVRRDGEDSYGMLFFAEVGALGELPKEFEMEKTVLFDQLPEPSLWTYPEIQPHLLEKVRKFRNLSF